MLPGLKHWQIMALSVVLGVNAPARAELFGWNEAPAGETKPWAIEPAIQNLDRWDRVVVATGDSAEAAGEDAEDATAPNVSTELAPNAPAVQTGAKISDPVAADAQQPTPSMAEASETLKPATAGAAPQVIHTDYRAAMQEAAEDRKLLFLYFHETRPNPAQQAFETKSLADLENREKLKRYVFAKLPVDAQITVGGQSVKLMDHPAFVEMHGQQGIAIIDLAHPISEFFGHVVSTFPFPSGKYYRKEALSLILDLPPGTLTQRTMIFAVRVHPESPQSTKGQFHHTLAEEAKKHANYQASIGVQGHHSWDERFHRINANLPGGALAQEVVAESWPNEGLVEACIDCVDSWRHSPGHWGAVRSRQPLFGYDIKRGRNGIWYATGIFGRR